MNIKSSQTINSQTAENKNMEHKILELKAADLKDNVLSGFAAGVGNLDLGNDVIFPNAFSKECLKDFLKNGFISDHHDWTKQIGMPVAAEQRGDKLYVEMAFHGTPDAQIIRQKCLERMDRGLSVGLSIGFSVEQDGVAYFDNGKAMIEFAKSKNYDMSLFDQKDILACKSTCRGIVKIERLYEFSYAIVQMNREAVATNVKAGAPDREASDNVRQMPEIVIKGQYLGDIERTSACGVIYSVISTLGSKIYQQLYATDASVSSPDDLLKDLAEKCDEARDMLVKCLPSLVKDLDIEELREQAHGYYDYYSAPMGEHKQKTEESDNKSTDKLTNEAAPQKAASSISTVREFEDFLREAGFSKRQATAIASKGFNTSLRDAGENETEPVQTAGVIPEDTAPATLARAALCEKKERLALRLQQLAVH